MIHPTLSAPAPISRSHVIDDFQCGEPVLDDWLKRRALKNETVGASRTFVVCEGQRVVAYYCLSAGAVARTAAPKSLQRNMPDPIPVLVLGRLAVDRTRHGEGIGTALLRNAMFRSAGAAESAGIAALLVHALTDAAHRFYRSAGFLPSPIEHMTLCLPIAHIVAELQRFE